MKIQTLDGTLYRVQFVHSAHDPKSPREATPGGLRQMADHLAKSLRRRVTLCEVSMLSADYDTDPETGEPRSTFTTVPLGYGFSICHYFDQFVKAEGRARSLTRALKAADLPREVREELLELCGVECIETSYDQFSSGDDSSCDCAGGCGCCIDDDRR